MNEASFLDDLARTLAEPMPRRRALRLIGGTLAAAVVPGIRPSPGRAAPSATVPCQNVRGQVWTCPERKYLVCGVTPDNPCIDTCTGPGKIPCGSGDGFDCCNDRFGDGSVACKNGRCQPTCKGIEKSGSVRLTECGEECCTPQQECRNNKCVGRCPAGRQRCGTRCCPKGQSCVNRKCCPNPQTCGSTCCPSGTKCAFENGRRTCCPSDRTVTQQKNGRTYRFCCPSGTGLVRGPSIDGGEACCSYGKKRNCCTRPASDDDELVPLTKLGTFCVDGKLTKL
jgi:hypothetical protein